MTPALLLLPLCLAWPAAGPGEPTPSEVEAVVSRFARYPAWWCLAQADAGDLQAATLEARAEWYDESRPALRAVACEARRRARAWRVLWQLKPFDHQAAGWRRADDDGTRAACDELRRLLAEDDWRAGTVPPAVVKTGGD